MKTTLSLASSALIGTIFGVVSAYSDVLKGSWLSLFVWAIVGLLIGAFIEERRLVHGAGLAYGFFLIFSFFMSGFGGSLTTLPGFALFSLIMGAGGALCGWALVVLGNFAKRKLA